MKWEMIPDAYRISTAVHFHQRSLPLTNSVRSNQRTQPLQTHHRRPNQNPSISMIRCRSCGGPLSAPDFSGLVACLQCGTVRDDVVQTTREVDDVIAQHDGYQPTSYKLSTTRAKRNPIDEATEWEGQRRQLFEEDEFRDLSLEWQAASTNVGPSSADVLKAFQTLLRAMCVHLVQKHQIPAVLERHVAKLWVSYLDFFNEYGVPLPTVLAEQGQGDCYVAQERLVETPTSTSTREARQLVRKLPADVRDTLSEMGLSREKYVRKLASVAQCRSTFRTDGKPGVSARACLNAVPFHRGRSSASHSDGTPAAGIRGNE